MSKLPNFLTRLMDPSQVIAVWNLVQSLPAGGRIMGNLIGRMAPYTGTISPEVLELAPGRARVLIRDRRGLRNHLNSVHAIALMNLGEMTTGGAMLASMAPNTRGIPNKISMEYFKKSRGTITCTCNCDLVPTNEKQEREVVGDLHNEAGELVARITARWQLGPASGA